MRPSNIVFWALAALTVAGCGGGSDVDSSSSTSTAQALAASKGQPVRAVIVSLPASTDAVIGTPVQLVAKVTDKAGKPVSGVVLTWVGADNNIATVGASGLVTPLRVGAVNVTASGGGSSGTTLVTVRAAAPVSGVVRSKYVGTNVAGIGYWGSQFPFADMMKSATPLQSREDSGVWDAPFPSTTSDGYPGSLRAGQHAITTLASDSSRYPVGRYVILWDGDGSISFPPELATVVESSSNRVVIEVKAVAGALWLSIDATVPSNPLRNIRFLWPGTESSYLVEPFNKEFLNKVKPFSVLRFMDWGATNNSPVVNWADRTLVSNVTYQNAKGVPVEVMIDLANKLQADPWFCIPHQATDEYVRNFATLLRARLHPALKPHIEYSNEVWNTGFSQTAWASAQSDRLGLARPWGTPSLFYAQRSVEIFKIMQMVYGPADSGRLVRVIAGQAAWTQFLENALGWKDTAANVDVMAIAPYFAAQAAAKVANVDATLGLSSDQIVDQMFTDVRGQVTSWIDANAALARSRGLKMKAYEAGSGNTSDYFPQDKVAAITNLFTEANRNPRMRELYLEYYGVWAAKGGDTMNQYVDIASPKPWGMWGSLEYVTQDPATAPKYRGLLDFIAAHPLTP